MHYKVVIIVSRDSTVYILLVCVYISRDGIWLAGVVFLAARNYKLPHITVSDCRHGDHGPPERVRDGLEKRLIGTRLGEVHGAREQHHSWKTIRSETNGRRPPFFQHHNNNNTNNNNKTKNK
jgi:hypothetical protein